MNFGKAKLLLLSAAVATLAACQQSGGETNQTVAANGMAQPGSASTSGGDTRAPQTTIAQTISQSGDHSTLLGAVKAAGLEETLGGAGPYTVFAPTNEAFQKLPPGAAEGLMQAGSKAQLTGVLTQHVVPGVVTSRDLAAAVERGGGKAQIATVGGGTLTVTQANGGLAVTDGSGGQARITQPDLNQSNGVVHSIDAVLMPAGG